MKYIFGCILFFNGAFMFSEDCRDMTDITHIFDKRQFEAVVQYVLDNGEIMEFYSSLWGSSPILNLKGFSIILVPNGPYFDDEYQTKMRSDVSHYQTMVVHGFWGVNRPEITIKENNVYMPSEYINRLMDTFIPQIRELIK